MGDSEFDQLLGDLQREGRITTEQRQSLRQALEKRRAEGAEEKKPGLLRP